MAGRLVISLDCEGRWGMADLDGFEHIRRENLTEAYTWLLKQFDRYNVPATFAFVGALVTPDKNLVADCAARQSSPAWFERYDRAPDHEGWHEPELLAQVRDAGVDHEIGCHSFSHVPFTDPAVTADVIADEIDRWLRATGQESVPSFVFPRNLVAHKKALVDAGVNAYREPPFTGGLSLRNRLVPVARDLNVFAQPQRITHGGAEPMTCVPQSDFLNHRTGLRGKVPGPMVKRRWQHALRASTDDTMVHLWFHPHNLIDNAPMRTLLTDILATSAQLQEAGSLHVLTQAGFAAEMRAASARP